MENITAAEAALIYKQNYKEYTVADELACINTEIKKTAESGGHFLLCTVKKEWKDQILWVFQKLGYQISDHTFAGDMENEHVELVSLSFDWKPKY